MKTTTEEGTMTAQTAHDQQVKAASELLQAITNAVASHGTGTNIHWGHVGDLAHVNEQLAEILRFIAPSA